MFLHIYEPSTDVTLVMRRLGPHEIIDLDKFALHWADRCGVAIDQSDGHIPACCGDIRVEVKRHKHDTACIWAGADYFLNTDIDF